MEKVCLVGESTFVHSTRGEVDYFECLRAILVERLEAWTYFGPSMIKFCSALCTFCTLPLASGRNAVLIVGFDQMHRTYPTAKVVYLFVMIIVCPELIL